MYFEHVHLCMFLDSHPTIQHSNIGVHLRSDIELDKSILIDKSLWSSFWRLQTISTIVDQIENCPIQLTIANYKDYHSKFKVHMQMYDTIYGI